MARKIKFIKDYQFANNGFSFDQYCEGEEHEVSDSCADSAIQSGAAEEVADKPAKDEGKGKKADKPSKE